MAIYFSGKSGQFGNWSDYEKYLGRCSDRRTFRDWLIQCRNEDPDTVLQSFSDVFAEVLVFLADGVTNTNAARNHALEKRAWVLLYALRPDLLNGESMALAAERMETTASKLSEHLAELRRSIPALRIDTMSRRGRDIDPAHTRERNRKAAQERWHLKRTQDAA